MRTQNIINILCMCGCVDKYAVSISRLHQSFSHHHLYIDFKALATDLVVGFGRSPMRIPPVHYPHPQHFTIMKV